MGKTKEDGDEAKEPAGRPAADPGPGPDAARHGEAQRAAAKADVIRTKLYAAYIAPAVGKQFAVADVVAYLDRFVDDAGAPADPVQRALVEQFAFAHLRVAGLHADAQAAKSVDAVKVLNAAGARLMAECRRLALTISTLRGSAPAAPRLKIAKTG